MDRRKHAALLGAALVAGMMEAERGPQPSSKHHKTKPPKNRDRVKAARKQNRKRK